MKPTHKYTRILFGLLLSLPLIGVLLMPGKAVEAVRSAIGLSETPSLRNNSKENKVATKAYSAPLQAQDPKANPLPSEEAGIRPVGPVGPKPNNVISLTAGAEGSEVEPNNTSGTATPITGTSVKITASINPNGDNDFYSFTAAA